jgi:hypothetical protein
VRPGVQQRTWFEPSSDTIPPCCPATAALSRRASLGGAGRALCRAARAPLGGGLAASGLPGRVPWRLFRGQLPIYAELGVLLEQRGLDAGEDGWVRGPWGRAGRAIQSWARARIGRTRSRTAFREVESELLWLARLGTLAEAAGIEPEMAGVVHEVLGRILARRRDAEGRGDGRGGGRYVGSPHQERFASVCVPGPVTSM